MADIWVGIIGALGVVAVAFITAWTTINSAKIKAEGELQDALTKARHSALEDQAAFRRDLMASLAGCNSRCEELKKIIEAKELQIIDLSKRVWALESRLNSVKRIHTN